jgi:four helix bundle protein
MTITKFEDLKCWKAARILAKSAFLCSQAGELAKDWDTRSPFRRAALSMMNNIAEGFGRYSSKDAIRFPDMARVSGNEFKSMLYLFEDIHYLPDETLKRLHQEVEDAIALTVGFIRYLNRKHD